MATQTIGNNPNPDARYAINDSSEALYAASVTVGAVNTFNVSGMLNAQAVAAGTATTDTNEDVLFTYSLPAGMLANNGEVLELFSAGTLGTSANTKTVKFYVGTAVYTLYSATGASLNWTMNAMVQRLGSASALVVFTGTVGTTPVASSVIADTDILANAVTIKVTGQEATAAHSGVTAYCMQTFLCT